MAIRFRCRDFLQPLALWRYRRLFDRAQWWGPEQFQAYQRERLRLVVRHAAATVPHYRRAFSDAGIRPQEVDDVADLAALPLLTKETVRSQRSDLTTVEARRFRPSPVSTTGSTQAPVTVLLDHRTNALEFAFYWRHWGWFGYRLGDRFAQLSWAEFSDGAAGALTRAEVGTGRLLLNALHLSEARIVRFASAMVAHRSRFLKGHPSALLHFALFVRKTGAEIPPLRAVFSTGEVLEPTVRSTIRDVLQAPVADAYGQMERVASACECPDGRMHVNPEYGVWELADRHVDPVSGQALGRIVGTGLHNLSMPLIRYDTGDLAEIGDEAAPCRCGRSLPTIGRVLGRSVDSIVTPEGHIVTVASIVFNATAAIVQGQLVQDELTRLRVRVLPTPEFDADAERRLIGEVRRVVGPSMAIEVERVADIDGFGTAAAKHRPVISRVYQRAVAGGNPCP
jgi:phenylacetate-CoA ligase